MSAEAQIIASSSGGMETAEGPNAPMITHKALITPADVHVLVVDDEHLSRTLVSTLLRRCDYTVTTAENGAEALALLKSHPRGTFQLLLTDICMPELNGIELLQHVKQDEDLRSVPVVMMSSIDRGDTVFECVQRGAEEYLVKPVTRKEVQHMWQHVLRTRNAAMTVPQALPCTVKSEDKRLDAVVQEGERRGLLESIDAVSHHPSSQVEAQVHVEAVASPAVHIPEEGRSTPPPPALAATATASHVQRESRETTAESPDWSALDATRTFLELMRDTRQRDIAVVHRELKALEADVAAVERLVASTPQRLQRQSSTSTGGVLMANDKGSFERSAPHPPAAKRQRTEHLGRGGDGGSDNNEKEDEDGSNSIVPEGWPHVEARAESLKDMYMQRRGASAPGAAHADRLRAFARDLGVLARGKQFTVEASLKSGDITSPQEMVCCADFDQDDSHFATASISRCVKVYDVATALEAKDSPHHQLHFPVWQATTRSKLSSVAWSSYVRSHLLTADYDGLVQLWDVSSGRAAETAQFDEHARRVWSLDVCRTDPLRFATGSDDSTVKLWSANQDASVATMRLAANVCCVQFSPVNSNILVAGCANHRVYVYDTRRYDVPAATIVGPRRAVSYVRFLDDGTKLVASSTDSALRMYDLQTALRVGSAGSYANNDHVMEPLRTFTGHVNERNFVGLTISPQGHIVTGSEDNAVHCYWKTMPFAIAKHGMMEDSACACVGDGGGSNANTAAAYVQGLPRQQLQSPSQKRSKRGSHAAFVSSVAWARGGQRCLASNSQGVLHMLRFE